MAGSPEENRPLGKPRCRRMNNINKIDPGEITWIGFNWSDVAQDRGQWRPLVNTGSGSSVAAEMAASPEGLSYIQFIYLF
jgi:hypothetical protein